MIIGSQAMGRAWAWADKAFNVWLIHSTVLSAHYHYLGDERWRQRCEGRDNDERERPPLVEPNDRDFPSPLLPLHRIS